jgi:hypothetical protein
MHVNNSSWIQYYCNVLFLLWKLINNNRAVCSTWLLLV